MWHRKVGSSMDTKGPSQPLLHCNFPLFNSYPAKAFHYSSHINWTSFFHFKLKNMCLCVFYLHGCMYTVWELETRKWDQIQWKWSNHQVEDVVSFGLISILTNTRVETFILLNELLTVMWCLLTWEMLWTSIWAINNVFFLLRMAISKVWSALLTK